MAETKQLGARFPLGSFRTQILVINWLPNGGGFKRFMTWRRGKEEIKKNESSRPDAISILIPSRIYVLDTSSGPFLQIDEVRSPSNPAMIIHPNHVPFWCINHPAPSSAR